MVRLAKAVAAANFTVAEPITSAVTGPDTVEGIGEFEFSKAVLQANRPAGVSANQFAHPTS